MWGLGGTRPWPRSAGNASAPRLTHPPSIVAVWVASATDLEWEALSVGTRAAHWPISLSFLRLASRPSGQVLCHLLIYLEL